MKVIDLLNKIANGEEDLPDIIIVGEEEDKHYYDKDLKEYINQRTGEKVFEDGYGKFLKYYLNDEVEIIEDKKIDKIDQNDREWHYLHNTEKTTEEVADNLEHLRQKVNQIIDYLKEK